MSETEPEKKGWFARFRSRGTPAGDTPPASETPQSAEPPRSAEPLQSAEPEVEKEAEIPVSPPPSEAASEVADSRAGADAEKEGEVETKGWLSRLREGLAKSTKRVTESITGLFTKKKLDQATLNELEDALIQADLGVTVAARLVEKLGKERFGKEVTDEEVRSAFADDIAEILAPVAVQLAIDSARKPHVVLVIGVNGSGKTTTIAKMAHLFKSEGRKVMLAAGDTFCAAAVEQLKV